MENVGYPTKSFDLLRIGSKIFKDKAIVSAYKQITQQQLEHLNLESQEILLRLINILLKRDKSEEALYVVEKVLEQENGNIDFLEKKGAVLQEMNRYEEAILIFERLTQKEPDNPHYHNLMGECFKLMGEKEKAVKAFRMAISSGCSDLVAIYEEFEARESLSFLLYEDEKLDEALEHILLVISKNSRHPIWRLLFKTLEKMGDAERLEIAEANYKRAKMAEKHFLKGEEYREWGDGKNAVRSYEMAISIYPEEPEYHYALGNMFLEDREYEAAEIHLTRATEIFPENERYLLSITGCLIGMEKYEQAYEYTRRGIACSPATFINSFEMLSLALERTDEYIGTLISVINSHKAENFPVLLKRLGKVLKSNGQVEKAREYFEKACEILLEKVEENPTQWKNHLLLADIVSELENPERALIHYIEAKKWINSGDLPVESAKLDETIARLYTETGEYDKSIEAYHSLITNFSSEPSYYRNLGINLIKKKDYKKAERELEKALGLDERDPETLYYLAIASSALKDTGKAVTFLRSAVLIEPDFLDKARGEETLDPLFKDGLIDKVLQHEKNGKF